MKTPAQIHDQRTRLFHAFADKVKARAAIADPATNGHPLYVHNWGNDAAKAVYEHGRLRWSVISAAADRLYAEAEHRNHGGNFRPLWCKHCKVAA